MSVGSLRAKVSKAFRVRGDRVRRVYVAARKAERFLRDAPRRRVMRGLPPASFEIPVGRGYLILPPDAFDETADVIREARAALAHYDATAAPAGKGRKRFLLNVLDASSLTAESGAIRFALRADVLSAVSRYLGVVPLLSAISVFHSDTVDGAPSSSQLHHCDGDDVTQIKVFVYCSDVDMRSGPLTVLNATDSDRVRRASGYQYRQRLTDSQVRDVVGAGQEHPILGAAGTAALVDTSRCFHFGSRVEPGAAPRLVTMVQYQTPYSFLIPTAAQASLPFRRLLHDSHSPLQRLVLGE
jgi:hypothetical protein